MKLAAYFVAGLGALSLVTVVPEPAKAFDGGGFAGGLAGGIIGGMIAGSIAAQARQRPVYSAQPRRVYVQRAAPRAVARAPAATPVAAQPKALINADADPFASGKSSSAAQTTPVAVKQ